MGYNFFDFLDFISAKFLMPMGGLLMSIFIGYIWKPENAYKEITNDGTIKFGWFKVWKILLKVINPILIILVFLSGFGLF
jgi:NSS family neurotransmitter:Na+ symporter